MHWRRPRISFTTFCGNKVASGIRFKENRLLIHDQKASVVWQYSKNDRSQLYKSILIDHIIETFLLHHKINVLTKWFISNESVGADASLGSDIFMSFVFWNSMVYFLVIYFCHTKDELSLPCLSKSNDTLPKEPFVTPLLDHWAKFLQNTSGIQDFFNNNIAINYYHYH